jgi:hypothetical protein
VPQQPTAWPPTSAYPQSAPPAVPYPVSGTPVSGYPVSGYPMTSPYPPGEGQPGYPMPGYYAPPQAEPPKRRTGLIIGIVVAVLVIMGGGGYALTTVLTKSSADPGASPSDSPSPSVVPTSAEPSPSPSPTPTFFSGDLRTLLLPTPKGAKPWSKPVSKDGNMTVDQYSTIFVDVKAAKQALVDGGYQRGAVKQWHATDDTLVEIEIIQFATEREAQDWCGGSEASARDGNKDVNIADRGELNAVPNSAFMIAGKADKYGFTFAAAFASKGNIMVEFKIWMPHKNETYAKKLAGQQFDRIPMPSI